MTATILASAVGVDVPTMPAAANGLADLPAAVPMGKLLRELTASWQPASNIFDRRREHRFPCDFWALLAPVDSRGQCLTAAPSYVRVKDVSRHGIGIIHTEPMPHRLALLTLETAVQHPVWLLVRFKWCRFKRADVYESGGHILRVVEAGGIPDALRAACGLRRMSVGPIIPAGESAESLADVTISGDGRLAGYDRKNH